MLQPLTLKAGGENCKEAVGKKEKKNPLGTEQAWQTFAEA